MIIACEVERCFCWNGCDEILHECIERSKYVKDFRKKLAKKKYKDKFKSIKNNSS